MKWKVDKDFRGCPGLDWLREEIERYDLSALDWITVRRVGFRYKETKDGLQVSPFDGVCKPRLVDQDGREVELFSAKPIEELPPDLSRRYRINTRVSDTCEYPLAIGGGVELREEGEVLIWLIAHEVAHYLYNTEQLPGGRAANTEDNCDAYADSTLASWRARDSALALKA